MTRKIALAIVVGAACGVSLHSSPASALVSITEFDSGISGRPALLATGADGNVWFTETAANKIGRISPSGVVNEFNVPTPASEPFGIAAGPDGNVWFTEYAGQKIGRVLPDGTITEHSVSFPYTYSGNVLRNIIAGETHYNGLDYGAMWFTIPGGVGRISVTGFSQGQDTSATYGYPERKSHLMWLQPGSVWVSGGDPGSGIRGYMKPGLDLSRFRDPMRNFRETYGVGSGAITGMTTSPGTVWALDSTYNKVLKMDTGGRVLAAFQAGINGRNLQEVVLGPDGNIWYTAYDNSRVGRVTPSGLVHEASLPEGSNPRGITVGADGNIWVALEGSGKIARLVLVNTPPVAEVTVPSEPYRVANKSVQFSGIRSSDSDGTISTYQWTIDGTSSTGPTTSHRFASPGTYPVSLRVTDNEGGSVVTSETITVTADPLPSVQIAASTARRSAGQGVSFGATAQDTNGTIASYDWRFGDGATAAGAAVTHAYAKPGEYTVTATATDDDGNRGATTSQIEVVPPLSLSLTSPADGSTFITSPRYLTWESADGDGTALPVTITVQPVPPGSLPAVGLTQVFEAVSSHTAGSGATELPSLPRGTYFWWVSKTLEGEASSPVRSFSVGPDLEIGRATKLGTTSLKIATTKLRSGTIEIKTPASKQSAALAFKFAHPESQYGTAERAVQWTCANAGKHTVRVTGKTPAQTTIQRTTSFVTPTCGRRFKGALADNRRIRTTKQSIILRMTDKWANYGEKYRVCLTGPTRRCFRRTTNSSGKNTVHAGHLPKGRYRAKWSVAGHTYASWRFRVKVPYVAPPAPPAWSCTSFECRVALRYAIGRGRVLYQYDSAAIDYGGRCLSQSGANRFDCDAIVKRRGGGLGFAGQFAVYRCFYGLRVTVGRYVRGTFTGGVTSDSGLANCPRYY